MKKIILSIMLIGILSLIGFSQDDGVQTLDLRDGTSIEAEVVSIDDDGLNVKYTNNIELTIPWSYLDPDTAYSIKRKVWEDEISKRSGNPDKTTTDYLDLAEWCKNHDMQKYATALYEYIIGNMDADNVTARKELGFVRHNGKWYTAEEWEAEVAKKDSKTDDRPDDTTNKPDETIKKKTRIKLKVVITHKLKPRTPEMEYTETLESVIKNKLEDMGYKVVTTNADYYIDASAFINQTKAVVFMEEVLSVKFEGDLTFSVTDLSNDEVKKDKVIGRSGRNELKQAIDDLFEDLATSAVSRILTICKKN